MYKLSVPIHVNTVSSKTLPGYIDTLKKIKAHRVFLCGVGEVVNDDNAIHLRFDELKDVVRQLKDNGFETGVWINSLGHGQALAHEMKREESQHYFTPITDSFGTEGKHCFCPADEAFIKKYTSVVKKIAELNLDLIHIDDDFRFISRPTYRVGCFCEKHLKKYYKLINEEVPRDKIESLIYTGGKSKYRTAYLNLMSETLIEFAKSVRSAVDEVNPDIRLSAACVDEMWSFNKEHALKILRAFAGKTKPFLRTTGAPYHNGGTVIDAAEMARVQFEWLKNSDVEVFSEGDVYPRPRYNVPFKFLELFEYILIANGIGDGCLCYMFDYAQKTDYETGYTDRYIRNEKYRLGLSEIFKDKTVTGVRTFNVPSKIENWDIPEEIYGERIWSYLNKRNVESPSQYHLSYNTIPTTFGESDYPVFLSGENAKYITEKELENGAILDITAAKILNERGIDTGLISEENHTFSAEYYIEEDDTVLRIGDRALKKIKCNDKAKVLTRFVPDNTPASYIYENKDGFKFYVLANDNCFLNTATFHSDNLKCPNYLINYYRQKHMIEVCEWLCGKKLPVVCTKNPKLYALAAKDNNSMAVLLANVFFDDVYNPEIKLDKEYKEIKFINCSGKIKGDTVYLSDISPYSFAAFEVK